MCSMDNSRHVLECPFPPLSSEDRDREDRDGLRWIFGKRSTVDQMFASPENPYVEASNPQRDGIWKWDLWEVIRLRRHEGGAS